MPDLYKKKTIEGFQSLATRLSEFGQQDLQPSRTRYEYIDRYVARESDRSPETLRARQLNMQGDKSVLRNFEPPIMFGQMDSALAYFVEVFLSGYPIFGVVANKTYEPQAAMMQAMMGRDSMKFSWARELQLLFNDALRYNFGAIEVDWRTQSTAKVITQMKVGSVETSGVQRTKLGGNALKRLDPYNTFYDTSVPAAYLPEDGLYLGYSEVYNYIKVRRLLQNLQVEYKIQEGIKVGMQKALDDSRYYSPDIRADLTSKSTSSTNWSQFFGFGVEGKFRGNNSGMYMVTTIYVRVIPKEFDIVISEAGTPKVYKLLLLNNELIYIEPCPYAHDLIPVPIIQAYDDGNQDQTKSFSENLQDIQDIATSLQNGRLKSLRRAVSDRGFYDPTRIRKEDIDRAQPDAKIAVKMNQYHKDMASAYYPIPYRDEAGATINQEFNTVVGLASSATGVNQSMQGNFVKGNKTLHEYDDIASNAQSRLRKMAVLWEATTFLWIKTILKSNYLQFAISEEIVDQQSGNAVTVDPVKLREIEMAFQVSDGVLPSEKLIGTNAMQFALQALQQVPELARQYKTADMAVSLIQAAGMPNLSEYRRSDQELQQYDQQQLAQQQALAAAQQQQ